MSSFQITVGQIYENDLNTAALSDQSLKQNKQRKKENKYKRVKARDLENHARNNAQTH